MTARPRGAWGSHRSRRREERGAVAVFAAVVMSLMIVVSAFAVDLGMQRVLRRDLQAFADLVASDLVRQMDGRTASVISSSTSWATAQTQAIARNSGSVLGGPPPTVSVQIGTVNSSYAFTAASGSTVPTAVQVTAGSSIGFAFHAGSGGATRTAVAVTRSQGCWKLGSWGARLSTTSNANALYSTLSALGIGGSVSAVTYQNLVGGHLDAAALSTALGLASPESLGTTSVSLATLLSAAATVAASNGTSAAQLAALNAIRAGLGSNGVKTVALGSLFSVASGAGSGLSASLNLADLVVGSILVANGGSAVSAPGLTASLPGVSSVSTSVALVQAAKTICGFVGSTGTSEQVSLTSTATLAPTVSTLASAVSGITALVGTTATIDTAPVSISVSTVSATGTLNSITCLSSSRAATIGVSGGLLNASVSIPVTIKLTSLLGVVKVSGTYTSTLNTASSTSSTTITVPSQSYDTPYGSGGSTATLPTPTLTSGPTVTAVSGTLSVSTATATALLNSLNTSTVTPLVTSLNSTVLGPLSDLSGLRTSGADVFLLDHPTCTSPALRG